MRPGTQYISHLEEISYLNQSSLVPGWAHFCLQCPGTIAHQVRMEGMKLIRIDGVQKTLFGGECQGEKAVLLGITRVV